MPRCLLGYIQINFWQHFKEQFDFHQQLHSQPKISKCNSSIFKMQFIRSHNIKMGSTKNRKTSKSSTANKNDSRNKKAGMKNKMSSKMKYKYRKHPRTKKDDMTTNKRMMKKSRQSCGINIWH